MAAKKNHFVDDKKFLEALKIYLPVVKPLREAYNKKCEALLEKGTKKKDLPYFAWPKTPEYEYIGEQILKIAEHLAFKTSYIKYSYIGDMIGDAIENSIIYLDCFDAEKYSKPFAYFTQIAKWAFHARIEEEGTHSYIKQKLLDNGDNFFVTQDGDRGHYSNTRGQKGKETQNDIIDNFETKKQTKKENSKRKKGTTPEKNLGIEKFMVEVDVTEI